MAEPMRADAAGLRRCEPAVRGLSSAIDEILRRLGQTLDEEGACWGVDEMGGAFGRAYCPAAQEARDAFPGLRDGVGYVGDSLLAVADNVDAAEGRTQYRFG